jgi:hypothetical protein
MRLLGEIFGALAIGIFCATYFHERGWKRGYWEGRKHADNWWIGVEQGYAEAREEVKMRKEGWP